MSVSNQAVFLSYASQDAEAVQRIAEALRAAGVEVWFDRNELVGGDAWDRKIRTQIRECALFVPVISAATQARGEGYFRLEWKLAVDRSHLMAPDQPFLLPIVIDDTPDATARVADEFRAIQWTHLRQGYGGQDGGQARPADAEALEKFCSRVKQMLGREGAPVSDRRADVGARLVRAQEEGRGQATPLQKPTRPWLVPAIIGAAVIATLALWQPWRGKEKSVPPASPTAAIAPAAPLTEAQQLVAKARKILDEGDEMNRETYTLAEDLLKRAEAIDVAEPSAWALHAQVSESRIGYGLDRSDARREALKSQANRALQLAPSSMEAQLADVRARLVFEPGNPDLEPMLVALALRYPGEWRFQRDLASCLRGNGKMEESLEAIERGFKIAPGHPSLKSDRINVLILSGKSAQAESEIAAMKAGRTGARLLAHEVYLKLTWSGDLIGAADAVRSWPAWFLLEDRGVGFAAMVALWKHDSAAALEIVGRFPRDYVTDYFYTGPRAVLSAWAHEQAGHTESARADWRAVVQVADRELAVASDNAAALHWKGWALARLGDTEAATSILKQLVERNRVVGSQAQIAGGLGGLALILGRTDDAIALVSRVSKIDAAVEIRGLTKTILRLNPVFDSLRNHPRFQALIDAVPGPEEKKENKPTSAVVPAPNEKSLVVLPLENLSPDPENAIFTEGMHTEIIATLQRTTDLRVIGRDSALAFKRGSTTVAEFAQRVGAVNVLTGSVRRAGTKARILLELRRASDDALLWSSPNTERELTDIWAVQSEVAEQVGRALKARESAGANAHARYLTKKPQAFDLFVKGDQQFFAGEFTRAIPLYTESYELDHSYVVPAYMLAHSFCNLLYSETNPAARQRYAAQARRWIEIVTQLDPSGFGALTESHYASNVDEDNVRALEHAERGMRALPNETAAPTFHAIALEGLGRMAEAVESYHLATQLDPMVVFSLSNEARALVYLRREPEALAMLARMSDVVGANRSFDANAHSMALQSFRLRGTLPNLIETIPLLRERAVWLWRARRFAEAERAAAEAANQAGIDDVIRYELFTIRHDALLRLSRRADADVVAGELRAIAQKLQAVTEVGPPRKAGWLASAEARVGHAEDAIRAAHRFVEDAATVRQQAVRWQREINFAELYAYLNRPRECIGLIGKLLRVPSGLTVPMLKVDPTWDNVREDPAFKALLADPKNSAPL